MPNVRCWIIPMNFTKRTKPRYNRQIKRLRSSTVNACVFSRNPIFRKNIFFLSEICMILSFVRLFFVNDEILLAIVMGVRGTKEYFLPEAWMRLP